MKKVSKRSKSTNHRIKNKEEEEERRKKKVLKAQQNQQFVSKFTPPMQYMFVNKNVGNPTYSHAAKQAESLSNGDNSLIFNNYNNNVVFRSNRVDTQECLMIDVLNRNMKNVNELTFLDKSTIKGICDGYSTTSQGTRTPISDQKIALSTTFGYGILQQIENIRKDITNINARIDSLTPGGGGETGDYESRITDLENENEILKLKIETLETLTKHFILLN